MQLGYWKIRGLVEASRMMLKYAAQDFEDVVYESGDAPDFDKSCWFDVKFNLGLDFPNLPYLMDGDVKLTQTIPIMHYLATKVGLAPPEEERYRCEMIDSVGMDAAMTLSRLSYSRADPGFFAANKDATISSCRNSVKQFSEVLGSRPYFAGDKICCTDFWIFECVDKYLHLDPAVAPQENIKAWMERIKNAPTLQGYFTEETSSRKYPLNNKVAIFGGK